MLFSSPLELEPVKSEFVSNTKYSGKVDIPTTMLLIFNQKYSPFWDLDLKNAETLGHFEYAGYANAWIVNGKGSDEYTIEYTIQKNVIYGDVLSIVGFLVSVIILTKKNEGVFGYEKLIKFNNLKNLITKIKRWISRIKNSRI